MPTTLEVAEGLEEALTTVSPEEEFTVSHVREFGPGVPTLDIYTADPAEEDNTFGPDSAVMWFIVRIRVPMNDRTSWQEFLYQTRDRTGPHSIREALRNSIGPGGPLDLLADSIQVGRPTDLRVYDDSPFGTTPYMGHEWRVGVSVS